MTTLRCRQHNDTRRATIATYMHCLDPCRPHGCQRIGRHGRAAGHCQRCVNECCDSINRGYRPVLLLRSAPLRRCRKQFYCKSEPTKWTTTSSRFRRTNVLRVAEDKTAHPSWRFGMFLTATHSLPLSSERPMLLGWAPQLPD